MTFQLEPSSHRDEAAREEGAAGLTHLVDPLLVRTKPCEKAPQNLPNNSLGTENGPKTQCSTAVPRGEFKVLWMDRIHLEPDEYWNTSPSNCRMSSQCSTHRAVFFSRVFQTGIGEPRPPSSPFGFPQIQPPKLGTRFSEVSEVRGVSAMKSDQARIVKRFVSKSGAAFSISCCGKQTGFGARFLLGRFQTELVSLWVGKPGSHSVHPQVSSSRFQEMSRQASQDLPSAEAQRRAANRADMDTMPGPRPQSCVRPIGCGSKPMVPFWLVGAPPIVVYFSGDWDVHWGYGILTHAH